MIPIFLGDHFFLSNLYLTDLKCKSHVYKSAEHLYQTAKCLKKSDRDKLRNTETGKSAKILGRFFPSTPYWDVVKVRAMERILRLKFRKAKLRRLLLNTGDKQLINQNFHHEMFWGVCGCSMHKKTGLNMLGKILMMIRSGYIYDVEI